jgi:hypothetical protein
MKRSIGTTFLVLVFWLLGGAPAWSQAVERLDNFTDWSAYRFVENGQPACYMASRPKLSEGNYTSRGDIYLLVTHRPGEQRIGEVSLVAGYTYKQDSLVEVTVGSRNWGLFTRGDKAWAHTENDDQTLVKSMKAGSGLVVKGTSSRGTLTIDTYSLLGFSKAYDAISKACGL